MAGKSPLGRQLDSIYQTKENLFEREGALFLKDYVPFVIDRCLSKHIDCLLDAQNMNLAKDLPKDMHYEYLLHSIRPKKRFAKTKKAEENPDIELIQKYYKYNYRRAVEALQILDNEQIEKIREQYIHE